MAIVVSIGALLLSLSLLVTGNGLLGITLAVRMNESQTGPQLIGLVLACYSVGFVGGAFTAGRIISRVGHIRSFAAFGAFACTAVLIHSLDDSLALWAALRVLTGFSVAAMFMVTESWLNERATNAVRGLMLSVYMVTNYTAAGTGQFLLNVAPIEGPVLFVYAAVLTVLSLVPLALTSSAQPQIPERRRFGVVQLYRVSPLALVSAVTVGIATGAFGSMGPVFAEAVGLDITQVSLFMGFGLISGLVLQFPLGLLSDRMDRRIVILGCNVAGALLSLAIFVIAFGSGQPPFLWLLLTTCACMSVLYVLYPLCVAHANDFAKAGQATGIAGGLLMAWGAGTILGPVIGSSAMDLFGPAALWLATTVLMAGTAGYAGWRMSQRPTAEATLPFVPAPAVATPVSVQLDPRTERMEEGPIPAAADDAGRTAAPGVEPAQERPEETPGETPGERPEERTELGAEGLKPAATEAGA